MYCTSIIEESRETVSLSISERDDIGCTSIYNLIEDRANVTVLSRGARASLNRLATMGMDEW